MRQSLRRIRATVAVTVPVLTLLGGNEPGELEGYGPIDPDTARALCAGAPSFIRLLTHPHTGVVMGIDRDRYSPPADLRAALRLRDQTCRFPGCPRAAQRCDLDHVNDWAAGGLTDQSNLIHLCRRHHRLRHTTGWEAEVITHLLHDEGRAGPGHSTDATRGDPGTSGDSGVLTGATRQTAPRAASVRWTSPAGRTYVTHDAYRDRQDGHDATERQQDTDPLAGAADEPNWVWHQSRPVDDGLAGAHTSCGDRDFVVAHVPVSTPHGTPAAEPDETRRSTFPDTPPF